MIERTKFKAFLEAKCPRCKQGNVFVNRTFHYKYFLTNKACPQCGFAFEKEPSFFTGAMYISYFMNVALVVIALLIIHLFFLEADVWVYFAVFIPIYLPFVPLIFRYSRLMLLYLVGDLK